MKRERAFDSGFTLIEMMISLTITSIVMAAAFTVFIQAKKLNDVAAETIAVNRDQSNALDLIERDLIQVGQGLPSSKVISIPNGTGVTIKRPGPGNLSLATMTDWPAVLPGPALGSSVNSGPTTDLITMMYADTLFVNAAGDQPTATVAADCASMTVTAAVTLEVGDIIWFYVNSTNADATQVVTGVSVNAGTGVQTAQFATGDVFGFNNRTATAGTIKQAQPNPSTPATFPAQVTRLRMVSYYVDGTRTPATLVRCLNTQCVGSSPTAGQVVAFGVENLQFSYDLVNNSTDLTNIKMTAADQAGTGVSPACNPTACSTNQIRKVNIVVTMRSRHRLSQIKDFVHRTLNTQVSLRNMSFMDKYPAT